MLRTVPRAPWAAALLLWTLALFACQPSVCRAQTERLPSPLTFPTDPPAATTDHWELEPEGEPWLESNELPSATYGEPWSWQLLPSSLIYHSYLAGVKEPRFASVWSDESRLGQIWDIALGGRVGIFRYGTPRNFRPDGWQLDMEGAVFPRLDPDGLSTPLISSDFRFGLPLTYGNGPFQAKIAFYHVSAHLGDEFMLANPGVVRLNYSRDEIVLGASYYVGDDLRVYGEFGYAPSAIGGAEPLEIQWGLDYSPLWTTRWGGAPFVAVNTHLREDVDFDGNFVAQAGWQWRSTCGGGHLARVGMQYFTGKSDQYEFFSTTEHKIGFGIWYDY